MFGVLGEHDLKERLAAKGVEFGPECRVLEVCNPTQAKNVLETNLAISTALPCRIAVYEEGGAVTVSTLRPTALLGLFGNPELDAGQSQQSASGGAGGLVTPTAVSERAARGELTAHAERRLVLCLADSVIRCQPARARPVFGVPDEYPKNAVFNSLR